MKLFRVAEENLSPSWIANNKAIESYKNIAISKEEIKRVNKIASNNITEDIIAKECEEIEKCASGNKIYHYNSIWDAQIVSHLKEYASAIGFDKSKIVGINPEEMMNDIGHIEKKANETNKIYRTASSKLVLEDPFHLEKLSDTSHMDKEDWQVISKQINLKDAPQMTIGVKPLRGGEDYLKSSEPKVAKNQNTISNPDAIKSLFESKEVDNGLRLKLEKAEREASKIKEHSEWEKGIIDSMEKRDIVPKGKVFPTEVMNAQTGLETTPSSKMGVYAKFDKDSIPERTEGEKIKESRKEWNDAMKRVAKEKQMFEMNRQEERGISDTFGDELKKALKK
jgi:hypothetical protein